MEQEQTDFKCGFVALLGRPNVGKSTLLNALIGNKISIVSPIPQTTRYPIRGILNIPGSQIVFVDTPGVHSFRDHLTEHLNSIAKGSLEGCDLVLYVVDVSRAIGREEETVMEFLLSQKIKTIMVLNKMDMSQRYMHDYVQRWQKEITTKNAENFLVYFVPVSARTGKNVEELKKIIIDNLPVHPAFYDPETNTDFPINFRIADIVREKLFLNLQKELPHSIAVEVEDIEDKEKVSVIKTLIYVTRVSQKKIVIGENGALLKEVGQTARIDIEKILNKKVFLQLWVKVLPDWTEKPRILKDLGYWWV